MASTSTSSDNKECFFLSVRNFPPVINGRIDMIQFINASTDLVAIVERLGTMFAPVKYDMQGNIDKMKKLFTYDDTSCLLELMLAKTETAIDKPGPAVEAVLWLSRALLFFEIVFTQLLCHLKTNNTNANMKQVFTVAYEGSVRKYHNWATQQIFNFICKMCPTQPQVYKSLEIEGRLQEFEVKLESFHATLHSVRCKIDDFFKDNKLLDDPLEK